MSGSIVEVDKAESRIRIGNDAAEPEADHQYRTNENGKAEPQRHGLASRKQMGSFGENATDWIRCLSAFSHQLVGKREIQH
jgi:hypothetical protein